MKVPLLDLTEQYNGIRDEVMSAVVELFDSQQFILGPKVMELESRVADYCGCRYAVGVSSGTDALLISLMAIGVSHGDMVITTPYTFFATAGVIARLGALPVFVDIDDKTYNMDPAKLAETISSMKESDRARLKAIIPVHLFGQCADMEEIVRVGDLYGLPVIEDAAQAIGAEYQFEDGEVKRAGSMGKFGCFSFFPSKNLGGFGDGGMVTTNEESAYDFLKIMRVHGSEPKYYHSVVGGNFRLDALQAAVLLIKINFLDDWTEKRKNNAGYYRKLFGEVLTNEVELPLDKTVRHVYNQFIIKVGNRRDELKKFLNDNDIGCEIYYPVPLHMQSCFSYLGYREESFPVSTEAAMTTLALPVYPELTRQQMEYVVDRIYCFFKKDKKIS